MKKWFSWIIKRYTQLKLDKKIALLYTALILIVSVTLTISITHTAGDIILRDRKDLVQQNVNVAKESVETELSTILNTGLGIVVSNAVQNFYTTSATSISTKQRKKSKSIMKMPQKQIITTQEFTTPIPFPPAAATVLLYIFRFTAPSA